MFKAQQVKTRNCKISALYLELLTHSMVQSPSLEVIIIIIIIFIQLQLGWNPVAEVYNTYTANV